MSVEMICAFFCTSTAARVRAMTAEWASVLLRQHGSTADRRARPTVHQAGAQHEPPTGEEREVERHAREERKP